MVTFMKFSNILELGRGISDNDFSKLIRMLFKSSGIEFLRKFGTNKLVDDD